MRSAAVYGEDDEEGGKVQKWLAERFKLNRHRAQKVFYKPFWSNLYGLSVLLLPARRRSGPRRNSCVVHFYLSAQIFGFFDTF